MTRGGPPVPEEFVPGVFRCAKCGFMLQQMTLHAKTGDVSARDDPGEKCPNDGSPLWRVTHEELERINAEAEASWSRER